MRSVLLVILILAVAAPRCRAASDPLLVVTKDTLLGAVTGLVLGGTLTLVIDDDDKKGETVRWGVVIGTFAGFGFGIYHASRGEGDLFATGDPDHWTVRDKAQLFRYRPGSAADGPLDCAVDRYAAGYATGGAAGYATGVAAGFAASYAAERPTDPAVGGTPGWAFRVPLVQVNW